jgi:hypothetical protein
MHAVSSLADIKQCGMMGVYGTAVASTGFCFYFCPEAPNLNSYVRMKNNHPITLGFICGKLKRLWEPPGQTEAGGCWGF